LHLVGCLYYLYFIMFFWDLLNNLDLTLILKTWRIWWAPNNAFKCRWYLIRRLKVKCHFDKFCYVDFIRLCSSRTFLYTAINCITCGWELCTDFVNWTLCRLFKSVSCIPWTFTDSVSCVAENSSRDVTLFSWERVTFRIS